MTEYYHGSNRMSTPMFENNIRIVQVLRAANSSVAAVKYILDLAFGICHVLLFHLIEDVVDSLDLIFRFHLSSLQIVKGCPKGRVRRSRKGVSRRRPPIPHHHVSMVIDSNQSFPIIKECSTAMGFANCRNGFHAWILSSFAEMSTPCSTRQ